MAHRFLIIDLFGKKEDEKKNVKTLTNQKITET